MCSILEAQDFHLFPEYQYFFNDEKPRIVVVAKKTCYLTVLSQRNRVIFEGNFNGEEWQSFDLPALEKKELTVVSDGHLSVPVRTLIESSKGAGGSMVYDTLNLTILIR